MDCSLLGSSVRRTFQARILEQVTIYFSRGFSRLKDRTRVSYTAGSFLTTEKALTSHWEGSFLTWEALSVLVALYFIVFFLGETGDKKSFLQAHCVLHPWPKLFLPTYLLPFPRFIICAGSLLTCCRTPCCTQSLKPLSPWLPNKLLFILKVQKNYHLFREDVLDYQAEIIAPLLCSIHPTSLTIPAIIVLF